MPWIVYNTQFDRRDERVTRQTFPTFPTFPTFLTFLYPAQTILIISNCSKSLSRFKERLSPSTTDFPQHPQHSYSWDVEATTSSIDATSPSHQFTKPIPTVQNLIQAPTSLPIISLPVFNLAPSTTAHMGRGGYNGPQRAILLQGGRGGGYN